MTHIQSVLNRLNRRKDASERGFSLIELIVVIVIMGILIAIAIPVYNHIQDNAKESAVKAIAANVASEVAAESGSSSPPTAPSDVQVSSSTKSGAEVTVTGDSIESFCVLAKKEGFWAQSGTADGCTGSGEGTGPTT